ncbi:unnamed protein product, partial [Vitis vinifera]
MEQQRDTVLVASQNPNPVSFTKKSSSSSGPKRFVKNQIPDSIINNAALNAAIALLPSNYNFEVHKCVWRILSSRAKRVALQFPEGLLMYSLHLSDIFTSYAGADHCLVLGDVTYGACCVDDLSAAALEADLLIHYGHSCLVPIDATSIPCLYVFVEIAIDVDLLIGTVKLNLPPAGQIISKTSFISDDVVAVFVADGRFHLEAFMIANPAIKAYRYDPYIGPRVLLFGDSVDAWIQIACPRLSIDWGDAFGKPLLNPFEAEIALGFIPDVSQDYPMDYYAQDGGEWNSSYAKKSTRPSRRNVSSCTGNGAIS